MSTMNIIIKYIQGIYQEC